MSSLTKWFLFWTAGVVYYATNAEIHEFIDGRYGENMAIGYNFVAFGVPALMLILKGSEI